MIQPQTFGKFILLERVNVGGMAEIYRAKLLKHPDFERFFAIKRILPAFAADKQFVSMFIEEAKVAVELEHPNVCQIYELGRLGQSHYIAMEYIAGRDVLAIQNYYRQQKKIMGVSQACFIIAQAAQGLDYTHRAVDANGAPLGLIHRDVSPQNLRVTFDGVVKLIDFGVTKSRQKAPNSRSGVIKGKFNYLSPEQARAKEIDHRSDIFSLGIIFWELLTGRRLFQSENELALIEMIGNCSIEKPSKYNRMIPDAVEKICLKALEPDLNKRYAWASEMVADLLEFINSSKTPFTQWHLQNWMCQTFKDALDEEWKKLPIFNAINTQKDIDLYMSEHAEEIAEFLANASQNKSKETPKLSSPSNPRVDAQQTSNDNDASCDEELVPEGVEPAVNDPQVIKFRREAKKAKTRKGLVALIITICMVFILSPVLLITHLIKVPDPEIHLPSAANLNLLVTPESTQAKIVLSKCTATTCDSEFNEVNSASGSVISFENLTAGSYKIDAQIPNYEPESFMVQLENGTSEARIEMHHAIAKEVEYTIHVSPEDAIVFVNGVRLDGNNARSTMATIGSNYTIKAFKPGFKPVEISGTVEENARVNVELTETTPIVLQVQSAPNRASVALFVAGKLTQRLETPAKFVLEHANAPVAIEVSKPGFPTKHQDIPFQNFESNHIGYFADLKISE